MKNAMSNRVRATARVRMHEVTERTIRRRERRVAEKAARKARIAAKLKANPRLVRP